MSLHLLFALLVSSPQVARADTITAGHPAVASLRLSSTVDTTDLFIARNGVRQAFGFETSETRAWRDEGRDVLLVVQSSHTPRGVSIDSIVLAPTTLLPLRHVQVGPNRRATYHFQGLTLAASVSDSGKPTQVSERMLARPLFDYSVITMIALRLPYATGYETHIASYDVNGGDKVTRVRVLGSERIANAHGDPVESWKLEFDFGAWQVTRWIDRESRREIAFTLTLGGNEMSGRRR